MPVRYIWKSTEVFSVKVAFLKKSCWGHTQTRISWCPHTFNIETPDLWALSPTWANEPPSPPSPPSNVALSISPFRRCRSMTFEKVRIARCWQMHIYYIYNKYFVNKLTTLSLYQKSFINSNIVIKIKCVYWSNYKTVTKEKQVKINFNFTQINSWCINFHQYIQNKIKIKNTHESNILYMLQTGRKIH